MNCISTRARFSSAEQWLKKIEDMYYIDNDIIESYTEYFLVICRSIEDYIINDFLDTRKPKIPLSQRSEIILNKKYYRDTKKINHNEEEKIKKFLQIHAKEIENLETQILVKYFRTLRNWTVHTIFPHIYENQHGDNNTILHRYFQRNFVNYIGLQQGGHLLLENGFSLLYENSDEDSFFDNPPLNQIGDENKSHLKRMLETQEAKDLLNEYLILIDELIKKFESQNSESATEK